MNGEDEEGALERLFVAEIKIAPLRLVLGWVWRGGRLAELMQERFEGTVAAAKQTLTPVTHASIGARSSDSRDLMPLLGLTESSIEREVLFVVRREMCITNGRLSSLLECKIELHPIVRNMGPRHLRSFAPGLISKEEAWYNGVWRRLFEKVRLCDNILIFFSAL